MTIYLESGVPQPNQYNSLTAVMRSMLVGQSFLWPLDKRGSLGQTARQAGIRVRSKKLDQAYCRVWRIE